MEVDARFSVGSGVQTQVRVRMGQTQGPARQSIKMKAPGVVKFCPIKKATSELRNGAEAS